MVRAAGLTVEEQNQARKVIQVHSGETNGVRACIMVSFFLLLYIRRIACLSRALCLFVHYTRALVTLQREATL